MPMLVLVKKEISSFFSSLTGYVVITVFLLIVGLFMWIFPGENNVLESGYAGIDTLFHLAPWVFLFLVPAVTMRSFAEERKTGTIELLLTRPLSITSVVLAKYLSGLFLVLISLLPTLFFVASVSMLGSPRGNLDWGATWGSYLGLIFLASIYVSVGVFASSITDNQIVAFIIAVVLCFFLLTGFDYLVDLPVFSGVESTIVQLGINEHYRSMSRGVLDTRDMVYFLSMAGLFLLFTRGSLLGRKW